MAKSLAKPKVQLTQLFTGEMLATGGFPEDLCDRFSDWKTNWPANEDLDYYFGKDGLYGTPTRNGRPVVRHVHQAPTEPAAWPSHFPPLSPADREKVQAEFDNWEERWERTEKNCRLGKGPTAARYRVSSRVLVYVDGERHGYLLLHLAVEPNGHDEATAKRSQMERWADVAAEFISSGTVIE